MELKNREFKRQNLWDFSTLLPGLILIILVFYLKESSIDSVIKGVLCGLTLLAIIIIGLSIKTKIYIKEEGIMLNSTLIRWRDINEVLFTVEPYVKNVIEISTSKKVHTIVIGLYENGMELRELIEEYCKKESVKHKVEDAARMWK